MIERHSSGLVRLLVPMAAVAASLLALPVAASAAGAIAPARVEWPPSPAGLPPQPALSLHATTIPTGGIGLVRVTGLLKGDSVTGTFNGEAIPFAAGTGIATALFGVDLDVKPGKYPLKVKVTRLGTTLERDQVVSVVNGKYREQSFTVPKEKDVSADDPELTKRIIREAKELSVLWPSWTAERLWEGGFVAPAPGTLKNFGSKRIINGKPRKPHSGADQSAKKGDPIHAINGGRVAFTGDQFFGGMTTVIDHGHGLYSMYMHQSKIDVAAGQLVKKGEKIGEVGATGRATGAHLHWGLRLLGARVDPEKLLALAKELDAIDGSVPATGAADAVAVDAGGAAVPAPLSAGTAGTP